LNEENRSAATRQARRASAPVAGAGSAGASSSGTKVGNGAEHHLHGRLPAAIASARDAAICALYREGATLKSIGAHFALSYEGVRRIAAKAGLSKRNAGMAARRSAKPSVNRAEGACFRTYGCTRRERDEASAEERTAFVQQRKNIRRDGVVWRLSLSEWRALWRKSGRWNQRGQGPSRYGMTRIDFACAVEIGNVEIVVNREAVRRARRRHAVRQRMRARARSSTGLQISVQLIEEPGELALDASKLTDQSLAG